VFVSKQPDIKTSLPFWLLISLSLVGYILIRFWFPLKPYFNRAPVADIRTFTPSFWSGLGYAFWLCLVFGLFGLAYRQVQKMEKPPDIAFLLLVTVMFGLPLLQTFSVNATDIYRYFIRGRITSVYGQSPFLIPPNAFPDDPYLLLAGEWAGETSPYGPVWELTAAGITRVAQKNLYLGLVLFKFLGLLFHLTIAALLWRLLNDLDPAERSARTLLWAWNPALLLTFVMDAHNDVFLILWLLLGLWIVRSGWPPVGFIFMVVAALTKPIGVLVLPVFFLSIWRHLPDIQVRLRFLLISSIGSLITILLLFLPFGSPLYLAERLLREASGGAGFSLAALTILISQESGFNLSLPQMSQYGLLLFLLMAVVLIWLGLRGRKPERGTADIFVTYILQALNFRIWYSVWPFPWLLLDTEQGEKSRNRLQAGLWFLFSAQLSVIIYGHLRVYVMGDSQLIAHFVGVPLVLLIPIFLAFRPVSGKHNPTNYS